MTYAVKDNSVDDGQPIECYKFIGPVGDLLYTTNNERIQVNGEWYDPFPISRSTIETSSLLDSISTVDITFPAKSDLASLYCFLISPEQLQVEIRRVHRGDDFATQSRMVWPGFGMDSSVSNDMATIKTGSLIQAKLNGNLGTILYQRSCNHKLYDERCKVNKADFTLSATVTKVQRQQITVNNDGAANDELKAGQMVVDRTGEVRGIFSNVDNVVKVSYAFIDLVEGDTVKLIFGCNHARLGHCKTRFDNVVNYGGEDFIATVNPFTDMKLDNEARVNTSVTAKFTNGGIKVTPLGVQPSYFV